MPLDKLRSINEKKAAKPIEWWLAAFQGMLLARGLSLTSA